MTVTRPYSEERTLRFHTPDSPDVPNRYGTGGISPSDVAITWRREDGRCEATAHVDGIWRRPDGELTNAPIDQLYVGPLDDWPDWLAQLARDHEQKEQQ